MINMVDKQSFVSFKKQRGIALLIALLMLPLLLALGLMMMNSSFLGLKIIDARVRHGESNILLISATDDVMHRVGGAQSFAQATASTVFSSGEVTASVELNGEFNCRRRMEASGTNMKCKYLELNFVHAFGREVSTGVHSAENSMGIGVEQPIIVE